MALLSRGERIWNDPWQGTGIENLIQKPHTGCWGITFKLRNKSLRNSFYSFMYFFLFFYFFLVFMYFFMGFLFGSIIFPTSHSVALRFPFGSSLFFFSFLSSLPVFPLGDNFLLRTRGMATVILVHHSKMAGVVRQESSLSKEKGNQGPPKKAKLYLRPKVNCTMIGFHIII